MSLDVSLVGEPREEPCECACCNHQHMRTVRSCFYDANITHNLGRMADEAGIYKALWRPEEIGITKAAQLIEPLKDGLSLLLSDPERFRKFDAPNGWGKYAHFVPFVSQYLEACYEYPEATVEVCR